MNFYFNIFLFLCIAGILVAIIYLLNSNDAGTANGQPYKLPPGAQPQPIIDPSHINDVTIPGGAWSNNKLT